MALKNAPDLTKRPPRSPRVRLGGYVILPRMLDKGRALVAGTKGEYNYMEPIRVPTEGSVSWEAESGLVLHGMTIANDPAASQGRCVFQPAAKEVYRLPGSVTWAIAAAKPGRYYLWARVLAPDPQSNSFHVSWDGDAGEILPRDAWHLREGGPWNWQRLTLGKSQTPAPVVLLPGLSWLQFRTREPETKIDRLFLTPDANARPE